jgi:hypothetical protein
MNIKTYMQPYMQRNTYGCRHYLRSEGQKLMNVECSSLIKERTLIVIEETISESDYGLFPTQMKNRGEQKFADGREVEMIEIRWLITNPRTYFNWKRKSFSPRYDKCLNCNWDYVEM